MSGILQVAHQILSDPAVDLVISTGISIVLARHSKEKTTSLKKTLLYVNPANITLINKPH